MPQRWISQLIVLAIWLASSLLLGIWFGNLVIWLLAAVTLYLANHMRQLYLLDQALQSGKPIQIYETRGLWPEIYARINGQRQKLRNRKKKYHRLLREVRQSTDALSDAGIILNSESEIQWFNPATKRLLGFDAKRDMNQRIDNLIRHPDFVRYLEDPSGDAVTIPSPINDTDQLSVQIIPYGKKQRMAIIRDITHQLQLERMRRDFVANASHELRSPLTVISGYLDGLEDEKELPSAWVAPMGEMQRQVERMTRILRDLIELTRMESAGREADREFVSVADLLGSIEQEFAARTEMPKMTFDVSSEIGLLGSESELHSIFYNLISNAARFTPEDGEVAIAWAATPSGASFTVTDTGIGILEEQIPRITERFFRVDPGRSREMGGTGLGLAIVKHALQRHHGTLTIASQLGEGSKFSCEFPESRVVSRHDSAQAAV
ncbi:MAG: phosphate regulon sensor histidine kinase PhoR [Candidatus Rariloculaceae bacterium]